MAWYKNCVKKTYYTNKSFESQGLGDELQSSGLNSSN